MSQVAAHRQASRIFDEFEGRDERPTKFRAAIMRLGFLGKYTFTL